MLVAGMTWLIFAGSTSDGVVYATSSEIRRERADTGYRLTGHALRGSIVRIPAERRVDFVVVDHDGANMKATYSGIIPDTFKDSSEVVISGRYDAREDLFRASELLAKCPSKYQGKYDTSLAAPPR